jgi:ferritin-like metal-binding protein YciE
MVDDPPSRVDRSALTGPQRLETIVKKHGANSQAHTDRAMQALINETEKMIVMVKGDDLRDAPLIASTQKSSIPR